jgi:hypothetical protein
MLHVFPEVDSKHSESEWNQDSVNVKRETKKCGVENLCPVLDRHKNVAALNNVISYSMQPEYHILDMDSFLQSQKHALI